MSRTTRATRAELLGLLVIVALAALLRLPGLETRGAFDADQGHDMLVLLGITRGEIPLLGPPTSIGTFHHGAVYYYLLAPAALLSGADPVAVTGWIAVFGIGAVAATWWLARLLGGPLAAAAAGLLAAISPAGIEESTFIWNPNLIPVASGLAFAAAIHAWQARSPRWWLLAATGAMVTMQCHVLGVVVLPPLVIGWALDLRRARREEHTAHVLGLLRAGLGAMAIVAAGYVPLLLNELTHDWSETRAILDYIAGGGRGGDTSIVVSVVLVALRSIIWPIAGLITKAGVIGLVGGIAAIGLAVVAMRVAPGRGAARGLVATFIWSVVALAVFAPGLAFVVEALPNDHYHAFLDPLVLALVGAGLACVAARLGRDAHPALGRAAALVGVGLLAVVAVVAWPPTTSPDGGWAAARRDGAAILEATGGRPFTLLGLPAIKSTDAVGFPIAKAGVVPGEPADRDAASADPVVIVCDPVFEQLNVAACGGPAEEAWLGGVGRFGPAPSATLPDTGARRVITIWTPEP